MEITNGNISVIRWVRECRSSILYHHHNLFSIQYSKHMSLGNLWLEGMDRPQSERQRRASVDLTATLTQFPTG